MDSRGALLSMVQSSRFTKRISGMLILLVITDDLSDPACRTSSGLDDDDASMLCESIDQIGLVALLISLHLDLQWIGQAAISQAVAS